MPVMSLSIDARASLLPETGLARSKKGRPTCVTDVGSDTFTFTTQTPCAGAAVPDDGGLHYEASWPTKCF